MCRGIGAREDGAEGGQDEEPRGRGGKASCWQGGKVGDAAIGGGHGVNADGVILTGEFREQRKLGIWLDLQDAEAFGAAETMVGNLADDNAEHGWRRLAAQAAKDGAKFCGEAGGWGEGIGDGAKAEGFGEGLGVDGGAGKALKGGGLVKGCGGAAGGRTSIVNEADDSSVGVFGLDQEEVAGVAPAGFFEDVEARKGRGVKVEEVKRGAGVGVGKRKRSGKVFWHGIGGGGGRTRRMEKPRAPGWRLELVACGIWTPG